MTALIRFPDVLALPQSCFQGFPDAWCLFKTSVKPLAAWKHLQVVFPFFNLNTVPFYLCNLICFFLRGTHGGDISWIFHNTDVKYHKLSWAMVETKVQVLSLQVQHSNQQSCGWGLSLLVFKIAILSLFFSPAGCKIKSNYTLLPLCVLLFSWFDFLETITGTS